MKLAVVAVLFLAMLAGCTDGQKDSDGDGLEDSLETRHWGHQVVDLMDRRIIREPQSDPTKVDTDGDGLTDQEEFFLRTDPSLKDTDEDGLTDCQETRHTVVSDCEREGFDTETEGDGGTGTDPRKADSDPGPSRYKMTQPWTDETGGVQEAVRFGDGISDGDEWNGYTVTVGALSYDVRTDPRSTDSDGDGLEDGEEQFDFGTNPSVGDTDGDGCIDGQDAWPARDIATTLGLETLHLAQSRDIRITAAFLLVAETIPEEFQPMSAGDNSLQSFDFSMAASQCGISPRDASHDVQISVIADGMGGLDIGSDQGAMVDGVVRLHWNLRSGVISTPSGVMFDGQVALSGADGKLTFTPGPRPE